MESHSLNFISSLGLYELWKTGRYKSYPPSTLIDLVARILALVPPWTRVYRVQRFVSIFKALFVYKHEVAVKSEILIF